MEQSERHQGIEKIESAAGMQLKPCGQFFCVQRPAGEHGVDAELHRTRHEF